MRSTPQIVARKATPVRTRAKFSPALVATILLVSIGALLSLFPFYWLFAAATRSTSEVLGVPPRLDFGSALGDNVRSLIEKGFLRNLWNTVFISLVTTFGTLALTSLAGYALGALEFRGRNVVFLPFFLALLLPPQVTVVPLFESIARVGLLGSPLAVILPTLASPFAVYFMRQTFVRFPKELLEAGRIDGASEWALYRYIALPNIMGALASLGIFVFLGSWNGFFWPLVALGNNREDQTLPVAISGLIGESFIDYGGLMAATALSVLPVLIFFLLAQRYFTASPLAGGVKD